MNQPKRRRDSLSTKLVLAVAIFMLLLLTSVVTAVNLGLRRLQSQTAALGTAALTDQGREALTELARLEASVNNNRLTRAAMTTRIAAEYLASSAEDVELPMLDASSLVAYSEADLLYEAGSDRITDLVVLGIVDMDAAAWRRVSQSAALDYVFPSMLSQTPDAIALYYHDTSLALRYYPPINVVRYLAGSPGLDPERRMYVWEQAKAAPPNNPNRFTVWDTPYVDNAGQGLLITASTPVYIGDDYQGIVGMDISLERMVRGLGSIRPTPGSYAFVMDDSGQLIAAATTGMPALLNRPVTATVTVDDILGVSLANASDPTLAQTARTIQQEQRGTMESVLGGEEVLLAYAPLSDLGWHLAIVVPLDELTGAAAALSAETETIGTTILRISVIVVILFFLIALSGVVLTNRHLTRPIQALVTGTETIAAGDLNVVIPVTTQDELGRLAISFNQMATVLRQTRHSLREQNAALKAQIHERRQAETALRRTEERYRQALEQRVAERTQELTTLLAVSHQLTLTLDLPTLFHLVLVQLQEIAPFSSASIFSLEENELVLIHYEGALDRHHLPARWDWQKSPPNRYVIQNGKPLLLDDLNAPDEMALSWRRMAAEKFGADLDDVQSWMGVPLIVNERVIGMMTLDHGTAHYFTPRRVELTLAFANQLAVAIENARLYEQAHALAALEERQRLARELHDSVSQVLYGIALGARTVTTLVDRAEEQPLKYGLVEPLDYILALAEAGLAEMRALIFELRPESLAAEGLIAAIEKQAAAVRARHHLSVALQLGNEPDVTLAVKEALYRLMQEALHNVVKHAAASAVDITLREADGVLSLTIADNGRGFEPERDYPGHLGLKSMRERVERIDGTYRIDSAPGRGTTITATVPRAGVTAGSGS